MKLERIEEQAAPGKQENAEFRLGHVETRRGHYPQTGTSNHTFDLYSSTLLFISISKHNPQQPIHHKKIKIMKLNLLLAITLILLPISSTESVPTPTPWPEQFHALLSMSLNESNQITNLYYDWPQGRNVNVIQKQLGVLLYDVEWNNGTSFYYSLGGNATCEVTDFEVGIPRPDFLDHSNYLGTQMVDGFLCHGWEKVDFIWYYEDVYTKRPVRWDFYDGIITHVITFEVGVALPDSYFQAPEYCFKAQKDASSL